MKKPSSLSPEAAALEQELASMQRSLDQLKVAVQTVIVGQDEVVEHTIIALLARGHVLLEGAPGPGKPPPVRTRGECLGLPPARIQFPPDLMPADITGTNVVVEDAGGRRFRFQRGPVFTSVLLADEINRATPKTQSALLEAMQEAMVTVAGERYAIGDPFFVLATQNPIEMEGTYPLPEAQLDRFLFKIHVPFPSAAELAAVIDRTFAPASAGPRTARAPVLDKDTLLRIQAAAREIVLAPEVRDYAAALVLATHPNPKGPENVRRFVRYGASPRGAQALVGAAKVRAMWRGRVHVDYEDVRAVVLPALRHRLILSFEGEAEGASTDRILGEILNSVRH